MADIQDFREAKKVAKIAQAGEKEAYFEEMRPYSNLKDPKVITFAAQPEKANNSSRVDAVPRPTQETPKKAAPPVPPDSLMAKQEKAFKAKAIAKQTGAKPQEQPQDENDRPSSKFRNYRRWVQAQPLPKPKSKPKPAPTKPEAEQMLPRFQSALRIW